MILIGKTATISQSANKAQVGLAGLIIEDTKDTIVLRTAHGEKHIVKGTATLRFADGTELETENVRGTHAARVKK